MKPTPLIIDTDPGIDDAVAIALALYAPELDVKLITTVAGNVGIEATTGNALKLLAYYGKDVPVAKGAAAPLIRQPEDASDIHGATGMEGFDFPEPKTELLLEKNAVEAMRDVLMAAEEPITIMPIGPLTNIALLLKVYPEVKPQIKEIVLMGGSVTRGNKGVMAEFNIYVDPEAAKIVLDSGLKITMATLDAGLGTVIPPEQTAKLKDMGKVGLMSHDLFQRYRKRSFGTGLKMYDSCAVACMLQPDLFTVQETYVDVELAGSLTAGCTVADLKGYLKHEPNATVTTGVDSERFCAWFMERMAQCD
ncbi:ribonucleoside hydrolase RihC [Bifidobacterium pullorum subsp. gallinarum]|uniref:Ribonucleoside hydrolase RihC n=1 Tax=Bifidobacterium pullorum subsp. gallinarum TaxID=78344 RepID=A0A4P6DUT0_9BIFI|nr:ribonucleoside hydrolase RihC [Bifidobacterium pullorum]QAY32440.1 ribonucleoside hydrolase RihC [Bifidobacterium pullorum subsp. gallinarum]